ncbi:COBRA-like protein, partial [Tanacetum coccineum]
MAVDGNISPIRVHLKAYHAVDQNGNITTKWDIISWIHDGYICDAELKVLVVAGASSGLIQLWDLEETKATVATLSTNPTNPAFLNDVKTSQSCRFGLKLPLGANLLCQKKQYSSFIRTSVKTIKVIQ